MRSGEPRKQDEYAKGVGELDLEEVAKVEVKGIRRCSVREL